MNFIDTVIHDLVMLESDMIDVQKELKKLRKINALQWVAIGYLLCTNHKNIEKELTIEDTVKEKCRKMFNKRREK